MIIIMSYELFDRLKRLPHRHRQVAARAFLFRQGDPVRSLFLVEQGTIELVRYAEGGSELVLQRASKGTIVAEASLYSRTYHCDGIASSSALFLTFSKVRVRNAFHRDAELAERWGAHLSSMVQAARFRAEILARRTVTDRLEGWLTLHDGQLPPKGAWNRLAVEIGVTPEALYREIAKRRR